MLGQLTQLTAPHPSETRLPGDAQIGAQTPAPPRTGGTKARQGKAAAGPVTQVLGPAEDLNGANGADTDPDDMGLVDTSSMSPGEARDAGLALIRQVYAAGHVAEVKALQKEWQVAKFYDVPVERGHEFYGRAVKLAQAAGLQI